MTGGSKTKDNLKAYLLASGLAASINYPLWRASAMAQSGFVYSSNLSLLPRTLTPYLYAFAPPYKGMTGVILGMTWARAAIFYGSDVGKEILVETHPTWHPAFHTFLPPLLVSTVVQIVNQPIVRASVTLQNPQSNLKNIRESTRRVYEKFGLGGLWHGTSAGILKTVPKYCTAVIVRDIVDARVLSPADEASPTYERDMMVRSAIKSVSAGLAGAALTNPLDVIRNEMFKTNKSLVETVRSLREETGWRFAWRGMAKNMVAVSIPVATTIFFTDTFIQITDRWDREQQL